MAWEVATILGTLGVSFYLLYLKELLSDDHETFKMGLMFASWLSILIVLSHIHNLILISAPTATSNISLAVLTYQTWIWLSMGFTAYWFIYLGGKWIKGFKEGGTLPDDD